MTLTTFNPARAREALPTEINLFPEAGGSLYTEADRAAGALGLTITDHQDRDTEVTLWLGPQRSAELHLWLTAAIAAAVFDGEAPGDYNADDLETGQSLNASYDPDDYTWPITVKAADGNGAEACLRLDEHDAEALYPLLTAVLISIGALG